MEITDQEHSVKVYWTLLVEVTDTSGEAVRDTEISVLDISGQVVAKGRSDVKGELRVELLDHTFENGIKTSVNPYLFECGSSEKRWFWTRTKL